jgi:hypothetical protein
MYKIEQITNNAIQKRTLILADSTQILMTMMYVDLQKGWFITELISGSFIIRGLRITNSPNMLHQFRNKLSFGLACFSVANREPMIIQDFASGQSNLYILSAAEVAQYQAALTNV